MTAYASGLSAKEVQALDAAKLYYAGLTQQEVAQRLHVSRPTVSKLLAYAHRRGFVRIEIYDPREQDPMLLDTLRERFNLLDVRLVSPVGPGEDLLRAALGREGARLLSSLVRDGDRIGAVGSRTLVELARSLEPVHRHHVELVQMARGLLPAERGLDEEACLVRMAQAFDAHLHLLDMPLVLGSIAERNELHRTPRGCRVMEMVDQVRIALFTVGGGFTPTSSTWGTRCSAPPSARPSSSAAPGTCARTSSTSTAGSACPTSPTAPPASPWPSCAARSRRSSWPGARPRHR